MFIKGVRNKYFIGKALFVYINLYTLILPPFPLITFR